MSEVYVRFGEQLRNNRENRKLALADVAAELRMSEEHIAAIEAGDATRLPGPLFLQMFARSYAGFLGLDYTEEIEKLRDELGEPAPQSTTGVQRTQSFEPGTLPPAQPAGGALRTTLSILTVILILAGLFFVGSRLLKQNKPGNTSTRSAGMQRDTIVFDDDTLGNPHPYVTAFPVDSTDGLTLSLLARVPCSILLITDGDTAINGEMKIAEDYQFDARQRIILSLGAPEAVDVRLNGQKAQLTDARSRKVSNLEITLGNYRWFLTPDSSARADSLSLMSSKISIADSLSRRDSTRKAIAEKKVPAPATGGRH